MKRKILLVALLLAFVGYAGWSFADSVTPYVGIKEAKAATSSSVQVKGLLAKDAPAPHMEDNDFVFTLQDEDAGRGILLGQAPHQVPVEVRAAEVKRPAGNFDAT